MQLTQENYFSSQADKEYMSVSQWKLFNQCEKKALATIEGQEDATFKEAYLEGKFFEEYVAGDVNLFLAKHPEMISSRGATAGQLKSEYTKVANSAKRFNDQKFFRDIIEKCEKQVILTGEICDIDVKCCLDLFDKETYSIYDIKCMKDFKDQWIAEDKHYAPWYYVYDYVLQLAVYREIVRQNYGEPKEIGLLSASKEVIPDLQAIKFEKGLLDLELDKFKNKIVRFNDIKLGKIEAVSCNCCDYCKAHKIIDKFEEVK